MRGRDLPWFSKMKWWQKLLLVLSLFVALLTLLLLPLHIFAYVIFALAAINVGLGFYLGWRDRNLH
jgi:hypothetical protein